MHMKDKDTLNFLLEMGMLRRIPRSGWALIDVPLSEVETVADHSLRAAQLGYILAKNEGHPEPCKVATMLIFHDVHETRVSDLNKVTRRYVSVDDAKAAGEQFGSLGDDVGGDILSLWNEMEKRETDTAIIAKDADYLECAITAKEYIAKGYPAAIDWMGNVRDALKTESAKRLAEKLFQADPNEWWQGLKELS